MHKFVRRNLWFLAIVACLLIPLSGCKKKEGELLDDEEIYVERQSFSFSEGNAPYDVMQAYKIQPGDVLDVLFQIQTWLKKENFKVQVDHSIAVNFIQTPELNQSQHVLPHGYVSLPYLGKYFVVGKTVEEITKELTDLYKPILREPEIYVTVPEFRIAIRELKADLHTAPRGLSRLVRVRPDGYVTFPMVGEIKVYNRTITEVNKELNDSYSELISGLNVDLFLENHSGSRIYILGEVEKPGSYEIIKPITVSQAIALSGSYRPSAKLSRIVVVRKHNDRLVGRVINLKRSAAMGGREGLFYLQPDDIVYIPKRNMAKYAEFAKDIQQILFFRGWGVSISWDPWDNDNDDDDDNPEPDIQEDP